MSSLSILNLDIHPFQTETERLIEKGNREA
jgi:hypothetical protein